MPADTGWWTYKMAVVGELSAGAAHELNNLMQGVVASLELSRRMISAARVAETDRYLSAAIGSAQRAALLNERLVRFSRSNVTTRRSVSLHGVLVDLTDLLRYALGAAFRLEVTRQSDAAPVLCNEHNAESVIVGLVLHARRSMPEGGSILLDCRRQDTAENCQRTAETTVVARALRLAITATPTTRSRRDGDAGKASANDVLPFVDGIAVHMARRFAREHGGTLDVRHGSTGCWVVHIDLPTPM